MIHALIALYVLVAWADFVDSRRIKMRLPAALATAVIWPVGLVVTAYCALISTLRRGMR